MKRLAGGTIQKMDGWVEGVHLRGAVILVSIGCHWLHLSAAVIGCHWLQLVAIAMAMAMHWLRLSGAVI